MPCARRIAFKRTNQDSARGQNSASGYNTRLCFYTFDQLAKEFTPTLEGAA